MFSFFKAFFKKDGEIEVVENGKFSNGSLVMTQKQSKMLSQLQSLIAEIKEIKGGATAVMLQESWFKDQYQRILKLCLLLGLIAIISIMGNVFQFVYEEEPKYFAATNDLRIAPLIALNEPMVSQSGLINWTTETVSRTFELDFKNWKRQLMDVRYQYSDTAFAQLIKGFKKSGNLEMIKNQRLVSTCVVNEAPTIPGKGIVKGKMTWKVQFPILVSYESSQGVENTQKLLCSVMVQRVSTKKNSEGIQIIQLITDNR